MKRFRIALLGAMLATTTLVVAAPALAGTNSTSWDHSSGLHLDLGAEKEVASLTHADTVGSECIAYVETNNGRSTHRGNNLNVYRNGSELLGIDDFEAVAYATNSASAGFVSTGSDDFVVYIEATRSRVTSSAGSLTVTCEPPPPGGGEGCTPGYWKQTHHFDSWVSTGYQPTDSFDAIFGVDSSFETLLDGAWAKGGQEKALARHAVAALLNASSPDVSYEYSAAQVIAEVQDAYSSGDYRTTKNMFEEQNEAGCPLN
jgi:hypothetical protein